MSRKSRARFDEAGTQMLVAGNAVGGGRRCRLGADSFWRLRCAYRVCPNHRAPRERSSAIQMVDTRIDFSGTPLQNRPNEQLYGSDPVSVRKTDHYQEEYIQSFVEKWDELIDWEARAKSEGQFFIDLLRGRKKQKVIDVATGTGFHSVQLIKAGFDVTSADGNADMLVRAFENGKKHGLIVRTVHADWRSLTNCIHGKYDAVICLGNSFTHLFSEQDRRRALAEFYAALNHHGVLILDQRNYDRILDEGFSSKHSYYYCGENVLAEPEYVDAGLARFRYQFPDQTEFHLNMFPLRKDYTRKLISEAGFQRIHTYGDFVETHQEPAPDFFIHVAEKTVDD